jgi:hypothetical protein
MSRRLLVALFPIAVAWAPHAFSQPATVLAKPALAAKMN